MREPDPRVVLGLHRSRYQRLILTNALDLGVDTIDTSFSYRDFTAHTVLAETAGDLLARFAISTKIGFFPARQGAEHSLDPARLRSALEQTNRDLGRAPDLVFLHNPERSVHTDRPEQGRQVLGQACGMLKEAAARGLCRSWGIASWDPSPLTALVDETMPHPSVLMIRAGLPTGIDALDASMALAARCGLHADAMWGMSPFGGRISNLLVDGVDPRLFLTDMTSDCSPVQAAFRTAFHLPSVNTVAVGTSDTGHLSELLASLRYAVDGQQIQRYLSLLRERRACQFR